jgi:hypothetical protein
MSSMKPKVIAGTVAGLAVAGGGAALAGTQLRSGKEETQAVVDDAARQLGIKPGRLTAALKTALENRVDEAVAAGRLTKEQGAAIKKRIESGDVPLFIGPGLGRRDFHDFGPLGRPGVGHGLPDLVPFGGLDDAATSLGLTADQLDSRLNSGQTLAEIAKARQKSVDGLVDAMYTGAKKKLDDAVSSGRLTQAQEQSILAGLKSRLADFVNHAQLRLHRDDDPAAPDGPAPGSFGGSGI